MRLDDLPESSNVEDRREEGGGGLGGFGGMPMGRGGLGLGTIVVLGLVGWALGIDPRLLIGGAELINDAGGGRTAVHDRPTETPQDETGRTVAKILGSTEVVWKDIFAKSGGTYRPPRLVLYSGATDAACGGAQSAMGPFYCPLDEKVYLDTSFFRELQVRFHGCDAGSRACLFAQSYVVAHEVGHHVQKLLGFLGKVEREQRAAGSKAQANHMQVEVELQADCFAGVWANHAQERWNDIIEPGDVDAALKTAAAIGDDRLQKQAQGYVVPDSFTHGTSAQRQRWLTAGLKGGAVASCNTYAANPL